MRTRPDGSLGTLAALVIATNTAVMTMLGLTAVPALAATSCGAQRLLPAADQLGIAATCIVTKATPVSAPPAPTPPRSVRSSSSSPTSPPPASSPDGAASPLTQPVAPSSAQPITQAAPPSPPAAVLPVQTLTTPACSFGSGNNRSVACFAAASSYCARHGGGVPELLSQAPAGTTTFTPVKRVCVGGAAPLPSTLSTGATTTQPGSSATPPSPAFLIGVLSTEVLTQPAVISVRPAVPLTGLATSFWLTGVNPREAATVSGGLRLVVTATPVACTWTFGDATRPQVLGFGTPWPAPATVQHVYEASGDTAVRASITWQLSARLGPLTIPISGPPSVTTAAKPLLVDSADALLTR